MKSKKINKDTKRVSAFSLIENIVFVGVIYFIVAVIIISLRPT